MDKRDEGRIRVGTCARVEYLGSIQECTVVEIRINPRDSHMYARCDDGSGDYRWFRLDELTAIEVD